jgi:hypothetical protein
MNALTQIVTWLNALANALGRVLLAPIALLPGWLSATIVAAVTGVLLLVMFKYTSNQPAIKRVRDAIKANLLSLKLFKDSTSVVFQAQGRILWGALQLFLLAIVPMLVMIVPVSLLIAQLAQWYRVRPLRVGEEAVLTLRLNGDAADPLPAVRLDPQGAVDVKIGPVRAPSQRAAYWNIVARRPGSHTITFFAADAPAEKELAIGDGYMRASPLRPGWNWTDALLYPSEPPFPPDAPIQSIEIAYPDRDSWTSGTDWWIAYWFVASMVAAFLFRPLIKVNI